MTSPPLVVIDFVVASSISPEAFAKISPAAPAALVFTFPKIDKLVPYSVNGPESARSLPKIMSETLVDVPICKPPRSELTVSVERSTVLPNVAPLERIVNKPDVLKFKGPAAPISSAINSILDCELVTLVPAFAPITPELPLFAISTEEAPVFSSIAPELANTFKVA